MLNSDLGHWSQGVLEYIIWLKFWLKIVCNTWKTLTGSISWPQTVSWGYWVLLGKIQAFPQANSILKSKYTVTLASQFVTSLDKVLWSQVTPSCKLVEMVQYSKSLLYMFILWDMGNSSHSIHLCMHMMHQAHIELSEGWTGWQYQWLSALLWILSTLFSCCLSSMLSMKAFWGIKVAVSLYLPLQ